ncbi:mandelate racemase/muconate lactonizing enzyme family protein [Cohnella yongneupensis]|uniref:Mandelate racemase/muconate lactonizing enzyme family protein n=1 Tax=Cohnella yongneupensis TaxID=425006 RepID=A0ABW0QWQ2_9BACL
MKIIHVESFLYRVPPSMTWIDSTHVVSGIEFIELRIRTDTGLEGIGISYTVGVGGTAVKALIDDYVISSLIGKDPIRYEEIWQDLSGQLHRCGDGIPSLALAAVDVGIWDLLGKFYQQPLYKLLGGAREQIVAYASGIDFEMDLPTLLAFMQEHKDQGYSYVKMKIGKDDVAEDIERISRVKEVLGPGITVLADSNQKWSAHQAVSSMAKLDRLGLGWIEEPIDNNDIEGHARLKAGMTTPIAVGESLYSKYQFLAYLKQGAVDFVQADVARVGGITEWLKIAHLADAWHKPVAPHFLMELSVHLLCGVSNGYILENVKGGSLTELGLLEVPVLVKDGYCRPSEEPGHGIRLNRAEIGKYLVTPEAIRQMDVRSKK